MNNSKAIRPDAIAGQARDLGARAYRTAIVMTNAVIVGAGYLRAQRRVKRLPPEEADRIWQEQHRRSAVRVTRVATRLRGMLIKTGQVLSARPDIVPEPYIEALATLQDAVPPHPFTQIAAQIERELGAPVDRVFTSFAREPVAAASLAQVHRATLADGSDVAVKVLYPGIEGLVSADLRNLGLIVNIVGRIWPKYDFRTIYREIARLAPIEMDLTQEASHAERIAGDLANRSDVVVPAIHRGYSSHRVLTMQYIDGIKINDVPALRAAGIDPAEIAERVVDIFGDQVLGHGYFHGDPHPGNLFALPDGRVALIDFGQTLALPDTPRRGFALLAQSAATRNPAGMIRAVGLIGIRLPANDIAAYQRMAAQTLGVTEEASDLPPVPDDGAAVNVRMARGFRGISLEGITGEALFVFRVQGLLRGLRAQLGSPGNVITSWNGYATPLLATGAASLPAATLPRP